MQIPSRSSSANACKVKIESNNDEPVALGTGRQIQDRQRRLPKHLEVLEHRRRFRLAGIAVDRKVLGRVGDPIPTERRLGEHQHQTQERHDRVAHAF